MEIKNRTELIYGLTEVAELEHTLMCQYLFAAASLKTSTEELTHASRRYYQMELIRGWKRSLLQVAREEMQHLTYAINLLVSVGGTPTFSRPNFPNNTRFYKDPLTGKGLMMSLEKFDLGTVAKFVQYEAPPPVITDTSLEMAGVPGPNEYATLHELYAAIKAAFKDELFIDYKDQYDPMDGVRGTKIPSRPPINNTVKSAADARKLIDQIMEQGEGSTSGDEMAHVNIFRHIHEQYENECGTDPEFEPSVKVLSNPMTRIHDDMQLDLLGNINIISKELDNGLPYNILQLFNAAYEILLTWLFQVFDKRGTPEELEAIESIAFMPYMSEIVRPLMEILTKIPVTLPGGKEGRLGAGFEVTTNNFLIPKQELTFRLSMERLQEMAVSANMILLQMKEPASRLPPAVVNDFDFICKSITLLRDEFESRMKNGVMPKLKADFTFSETAATTKPPVINIGLVTAQEWNLRGPTILELQFEGWFQVWLASDPDGANEKRGVTGNNFSAFDEPEFDRIIHFQPKGAVQRSNCPAIGVKVTSARIIKPPMGLNLTEETDLSMFNEAEVDLLDHPKFEGRNYIVAGVGEPIDPFTLEIRTRNGLRVCRSVIGNGKINDMTSAQRSGTGRYVAGGAIDVDKMKEFLKRIGYASPHDYLDKRISSLKAGLSGISADYGAEAVKLRLRLRCLEETKASARGKPEAAFIRWTRFFFAFDYTHTLSGEEKIFLNGKEDELPFTFKVSNRFDYTTRWLIDYHMGFYDSDALSGYVYGAVKIPIDMK